MLTGGAYLANDFSHGLGKILDPAASAGITDDTPELKAQHYRRTLLVPSSFNLDDERVGHMLTEELAVQRITVTTTPWFANPMSAPS